MTPLSTIRRRNGLGGPLPLTDWQRQRLAYIVQRRKSGASLGIGTEAARMYWMNHS
jgi:hypothetical protein